MTEAEWAACATPDALIQFAGHGCSERKLRLFACACCRQIWDCLLADEREAVRAAERFVDGRASATTLRNNARARIGSAWLGGVLFESHEGRTAVLETIRQTALLCPYRRVEVGIPFATRGEVIEPFRKAQASIYRDVLGPFPFRPVASDASWRSSAVLGIARGIYAERAFDRLPILADALMDAGCEHPDVLAHCRGDGPHARGCWVVDLLLGKT